MSDFTWTDDRVALLRKLWSDGLSCSKVAARLNEVASKDEVCTRNAVIGKVHRLGLSGRTARVHQPKTPPKPKPILVVSAPRSERLPVLVVAPTPSKPRPVPITDAFVIGSQATIPFVELPAFGRCKWPLGDEPRFCGAVSLDPTNPDCPYCERHSALAYQRASNAGPRSPAQDAAASAWSRRMYGTGLRCTV